MVCPPATSKAGYKVSCHFKLMNDLGQFYLSKPLRNVPNNITIWQKNYEMFTGLIIVNELLLSPALLTAIGKVFVDSRLDFGSKLNDSDLLTWFNDAEDVSLVVVAALKLFLAPAVGTCWFVCRNSTKKFAHNGIFNRPFFVGFFRANICSLKKPSLGGFSMVNMVCFGVSLLLIKGNSELWNNIK
jgi:hypothetical protein